MRVTRLKKAIADVPQGKVCLVRRRNLVAPDVDAICIAVLGVYVIIDSDGVAPRTTTYANLAELELEFVLVDVLENGDRFVF